MTAADDARALVARTRAAQGLPEKVTDRAVLARVAGILAGAASPNATRPRAITPGADANAVTITSSTAIVGSQGVTDDFTP